jgi:dTMP kinase
MARGRFVVIEGIDGSGTTTQVALLKEHLRTKGIVAHQTHEPSDGPIGSFIRQVLTGRVIVPGGRAPGWATMALLFAADRMDHIETEISPNVAEGRVVLSDRYDASSLAYQSVTSGSEGVAAVDWIRSLNRYAMRPDLTIVLDVSAEAAAERRAGRGEPAELYEQNEVQRALAEFYRALPRHMPDDKIVVVDGSGDIRATHALVVAAYAATCG